MSTRVFETRLAASHPVLDHHRVFGRAVLPGLAYVDLLYQLAAAGLGVDHREFALRKLTIHSPLALDVGAGIDLAFRFEAVEAGWDVGIGTAGAVRQTPFATAQLRREPIRHEEFLDIPRFVGAASHVVAMDTIYAAARGRGLVHSGLMVASGEVHVLGRDRLVRLLTDDDEGNAGLLFHPGLIDGAAMATDSLRGADDTDLYLPLCYDAFTCSAPLGAECWALIRGDSVRSANDIHTLDIAFHDADGRQIAALDGITSKRVRSAEHVTHARAPVTPRRRTETTGGRAIDDVLREIVAAYLDVSPATVNPAAGFFTLGLQSSQLLAVVNDIERSFELTLSPTLLFEYGTLDEVGAYLSGELARRAPVSAAAIAVPLRRAEADIEYEFAADDELLADHRVYGRPALMGIAHPCLAADSALRSGIAGYPLVLERIVFHGGPIMPVPHERVRLGVDWSADRGAPEFRVARRQDNAVYCVGHVSRDGSDAAEAIDVDAVWSKATALTREDVQRIYSAARDFELGATLRTIERAARTPSTLITQVCLADGRPRAPDGRAYALDPLLLAACFSLDAAVEPTLADGAALVPLAIERLTVFRAATGSVLVVNTVRVRREGYLAFDAAAYTEDGECIVEIRNASLVTLRDAQFAPASEPAAATARTDAGVVPIAVIGLSGRYPQAPDLAAFWQNLVAGRDCITEIPSDRWDWRDYYASDAPAPGRIPSKWGGFIDGVDQFAPLFFSIAPRDAAFMDPQERLFLEESWNALEDAGYTRAALGTAQVGVYVGVMSQDYALYAVDPAAGAGRVGIPSGIGSIANRVSYWFDFHGPSITIDTMCSGSLTAIALACDALRDGRIDAALTGGVNVSVHPNKYLMLGQGGFLSAQGRCGSFGTGSGGYVPSEGVGVAVLKRLDAALRDGDQIHGVIRGIAINHGGHTSGYSVPNPQAQHDVIRRAWRQSGIDPRRITYIEAHGTGTVLGDPIEVEGLTRAFREHTPACGFCAIGSVKSNVGHCESAAGIAALTKVLLQLRHAELVPSLHCDVLNPNIDFARSPFVVQRHAAPWPRPVFEYDGREIEQPRAAGISSFGAGGANAHLVVEEFVDTRAEQRAAGPALIVLSARSDAELDALVARLLQALQSAIYGEGDLARIAYTLQTGREAMEERLALVVDSIGTLRERLAAWLDGMPPADCVRARAGADSAFSAFTRDDDLGATVATWFAQGKLAKVAQWWVHGAAIDWSHLYPRKPRRIGLPTYPFARQRCWIGDGKPMRPVTESAGVLASNPASPHVFAETWAPRDLEPAAAELPAAPVCLVFASKAPQRVNIATAIARWWPHAHVVFVAESRFAEVDAEGAFSVSCDDPVGFKDVFATLRARHSRLDFVFHLWALDDSASVVDAAALMLSLQALAGSGITVGRFLAAGRYEAGTLAECHLEVHDALVHSARLLLPGAQLATVFEEIDADGVDDARCAQRLIAAARAAHLESSRHRGAQRLTREFRAVPIELERMTALPYKAGGTYLITGGLGGLGLIVARHFARTLRARLVLIGRAAIDERRRAAIAELEALGATVTYLACDVADATTLRATLDAVRSDIGPIHGVVHAAGIAGSTAPSEKTRAEFDGVLAPKIAGTLALDAVLDGDPLDFVCYFSSVAAVLGDFGGGDYSAANRFQLAYARLRNRSARPGRSVAICWPLWQDGGLEFGSRDLQDMYLKTSGQKALDADTALQLLAHLLGDEFAARADAAPIVLVGERERLAALLAGTPAPAPATPAAAPLPPAAGDVSLVRRVEHDLKTLVGALLHIAVEQVQRGTNLADFGFDSVSLQELAARLSERYGFNVAPALFFDHPTIERLAAHFIASHSAAMAAVFDAVPVAEAGARAAPQVPRTLPAASRGELPEPIAVIGMSGRFPQARNIDEMWELLARGADAIEEIPAQRFDWRRYYAAGDTAVAGRTNCKWSGIVPGADEFDPLFFEIAPREAALIDPRQRLLLQESYRALEDAGYGPAQLAAGCVGIFVGAEAGAYGGADVEKETITANHEAVLAARLSYFLDLSGPNVAINTACSSGLVALHQACLHLRTHECDTAIVAAVNLLLAPESFVGMSQAGMLSPDGRCFAFDRRANGMVPGEAIVALVLKRVTAAEADGDPIHALIRGSGVNHDGRTNGLTAPSGRAQQRLLSGVYGVHGIDPGEIDYVIAHGTATNLGDQIEIRALCEAFATHGVHGRHCALTSTKSNFGHTFAASGLVSVVAMIAAMRHALIPRSLHCREESDFVHWEDSPFFVNKANRPWPATSGKARLGAVSAFGMSGTNAHVVIESREAAAPLLRRPQYLLVLSGRNDDALRRRAEDLSAWLASAASRGAVDLAGASHTLLAGRRHHRYRLALVVDSAQGAIEALNAFAADMIPGNVRRGVVERDYIVEADAHSQVEQLVQQCSMLTDGARLLGALLDLATAYCVGHELDSRALWEPHAPRRIHLPGYPFERQHYWRDRVAAPSAVSAPAPAPAPAPGPTSASMPAPESASLSDHVITLVLEHLGVARADIDDEDPLDEFGLDSIGAAKLVAQIRELLPDAVNSLFLEYNTLSGVRGYVETFRDRAAAFALAQSERAAPATAASAPGATSGVGIVGLAGLFPGAATVAAFWDNLCAEAVVTGPLPQRRRALLGLAPDGPLCHGGYLDAVECFDHERFKMTREDARSADPQLRKLLEVVWQAIADTGYTAVEFKKLPTGVFVATAGHSGYREIPDYREPGTGLPPAETPGLYANRLSNLFDFKGPSAVVDAGCASFLVALDNAVSAIEAGRCDQAVVAAAQMYLSPHALAIADHGALYSKGTMMRSFAHDSDGYLRSEVVGALIVKRIADAARDGDDVYCRVLGAGVCHGGKSPLKWYSPNVKGQRAAIRAALERAGVAGHSVGYVEADANGSQLGDASEIVALQSEYRCTPDQAAGTTYIGSLKPLCGHAEAASTFPALVKVIMSLRHRLLLGVVDPGELNKGIVLKPGFEILTAARPWHAGAAPRRGAVHSFSVGGVNAHVVLEESSVTPPPGAPCAQVFVYSARTPELLRATVAAQLAFLARCDDDEMPSPADVAHTLQVGRDAEPRRLAVVATTLAELAAYLADWLETGGPEPEVRGDDTPTDLRAQAQSWVGGAAIDWRAVHAAPRRRVHLPPASLRHEVHWHHAINPASARTRARVERAEADVGAVLLRPKWTAQTMPSPSGPSDTVASPRRTVLFCGWPRTRVEEFRQYADTDDVRELEVAHASPAEQFQACSKAVFSLVREILGGLRSGRALLQLVVPGGLDYVGLHGLVGLIRTAAKEHSRFAGQIIVVDRDTTAVDCISAVRRTADCDTDYVQLRDNTRWTQSWEVVPADDTPAQISAPIQAIAGGKPVVLVTGGAGGIGLDLAERILQRNGLATVVLAGRSLNPRTSERIARLHVRSGRLHYVQADVGSAHEVSALVAEVLRRFGHLTGIFHCAGVTRDGFIVHKKVDDLDAVLAPKVAGLYHLDEATKDVPLDFLVAFSSLSSMFGNPGQADYSMANSFMDAFAAYRNQLVCLGERSGRTLSINWPLWSGGGMTMSEEFRQHLEDEHGWMPMPNSVGVDIALDLLDESATQIAVTYGLMAKLLGNNLEADCV